MTDIIETIQSRYGEYTKTQKKVADYVTKYTLHASFMTIDSMAHEIGVSTMSIIRLAMVLGYSGYSEFQHALQEYLKNWARPSLKLKAKEHSDGAPNNLIEKIVTQQIENLELTYNAMGSDSIMKATKIISNAEQVFIMGMRSSYSVAHYLNYNINRMFGHSSLISAEGGEEYDKLLKLDDSSVLIAFTLPRYVEKVQIACQVAKQRGAKVIAITDKFSSPIASDADVVFCVETSSIGFHNSILSSMLIAEIIIGSLTEGNHQHIEDRLKEMEDVLYSFHVHVNK